MWGHKHKCDRLSQKKYMRRPGGRETRYQFIFLSFPRFCLSSTSLFYSPQVKSCDEWVASGYLRELRQVSGDVCVHCPIEIEGDIGAVTVNDPWR
jgi:hypothetical protein